MLYFNKKLIKNLCLFMVKLLANKWGNSLNLIKDICMHANSLLSCPTLCNPMAVGRQAPLSMGILQARILEWVAISFSNA